MPPTPDRSRDLLFGLLALQNGLIDQDQLVAAFRAWTRDKGRPLAEILLGQGALDAEDRVLLDALVQRHLQTHGGEPEQSLAAMALGRSTRESLAGVVDADMEASLAHVGTRVAEPGDLRPHRQLRRGRGDQRRRAVPHPPAPRPRRPG